ncbi:MAG TPA: hypothetical protein VNI36_00335, partial [Candidatus Dormibacteraeota bacterium]|nr:hypothetical protein [Candidatus Dormibacteraeota bacterium]
MPVSSWIRNRKGTHAAEDPASELICAAARGDSLNQLLDLGACTLLVTAKADRAGVWLAGDRRGKSGQGRVVEAEPGPIPEKWKHLDISNP